LIICTNNRQYYPGENVMALTYFAPEFHVGTVGSVLKRANGRLLAIRTLDGQILKWFTIFELESADPEDHILREGHYAYVTTDRLGFSLEKGAMVQIVKRIDEIDYYEVSVNNGSERYRVTSIDITSQL